MHMANETSALAAAEAPGEEEYQAFCAVLAESARGRAFLAEHARRARQADTMMLLTAFERLEARIAAQAASVPVPVEPPLPAASEPAAEIDSVRKSAAIPEVMLFEAQRAVEIASPAEVPVSAAAEPDEIAQPATSPRDPLAAVMTLSEEERIALFT
jgi:hypothetical protein